MRDRWTHHLGRLVLLGAALLWLAPYAWMTLTSLKTLPEILEAPTYPLPKSFDTSAYREVFHTLPLSHYFWNSFVMATSIAVIQILFALPAGYALAKLKFRGKATLFGFVVACLLVPPQVTFVPVFIMFGHAGLLNSMTALVLPFAVSAFGTFLIRQALLSVPDEIIEAARLDGASELRIIYGLMAPILRPTLVAVFLFSFIYHYSDYFWPLTMTMDDSARTLPVGIALLREQGTGARWHVLMAGNVILSAPILLLFAGAQRQIVRAVASR